MPLNKMATSAPIYALGSILAFVAAVVILIVTNHEQGNGGMFIAFAISTLPSLVAALFAERSARDIRNGVVQDKVRQGATDALQETGVTEVAQTALQTQAPALTALAQLLQTLQNVDVVPKTDKGGKDSDER